MAGNGWWHRPRRTRTAKSCACKELDAANRKFREYKRECGNVTEGRDWTWHDTMDAIAAAMLAAK
jgi:hypothetical protein